jgi:hypothetical protein
MFGDEREIVMTDRLAVYVRTRRSLAPSNAPRKYVLCAEEKQEQPHQVEENSASTLSHFCEVFRLLGVGTDSNSAPSHPGSSSAHLTPALTSRARSGRPHPWPGRGELAADFLNS